MSHYISMILAYLEHYQPERLAQLKREQALKAEVDTLLDVLHEETARISAELEAAQPEVSPAQRMLEAEAMAIASVLPLSVDSPRESATSLSHGRELRAVGKHTVCPSDSAKGARHDQ